ncbi:MAG: hypothetical protein IKZ49_00870 [Alphaproteobacteria bacterium]|nr:hypothetical protein [Alphaproteobacteria bacterium]
MKLFKKIKYNNGLREIYFCGIKVFSYHKRIVLRKCDNDILKFIGIQKCKDLKNLVLGSSHGRDGFIPEKFDFNLSNSSLDMYRIWNLYSWVVKHNGKNLKNIIIFWSVFHAGLQLEKTREFKRCIPYKALFGIDYACDFKIDDRFALNQINQWLRDIRCPREFRGKSRYDIKHDEMAEELAYKHVKNTKRNNNQIQYLQNIADLARKKKQKVYVVLPPYRSDYLKCLPDKKEIYFELYDFLDKNRDVKLLDFQFDKDFKDSDFDSPDHCNENGGKKLTKKIKQSIHK